MANDHSSLGDAATECPSCGECFQLFTGYDDQQYVKHLEDHLEDHD